MLKVATFMETLIQEGLALEALTDENPTVREGQSFTRRYKRWSKNVVEILAYVSMETHLTEARDIIKSGMSTDEYKVLILAGLLESAYDLLKMGLLARSSFSFMQSFFPP